VNNHRFELFVPQERRLAESASKHLQVIRRGIRCEVTESNVNSMSRVRNFIRGTSYIRHRVISVSGQSAGKTSHQTRNVRLPRVSRTVSGQNREFANPARLQKSELRTSCQVSSRSAGASSNAQPVCRVKHRKGHASCVSGEVCANSVIGKLKNLKNS
jgi:hypothetical protein